MEEREEDVQASSLSKQTFFFLLLLPSVVFSNFITMESCFKALFFALQAILACLDTSGSCPVYYKKKE